MTVRKVSAISTGLTTAVTAYSIGDVVGNRFTFVDAVDWSQDAGQIRDIIITDKAGVLAACELWFFGQNVTQANMVDNLAPAIVDAELPFLIGRAVFAAADSTILAANGFLCYSGRNIYFKPSASAVAPQSEISAHLITKSANTFFAAVTDIQIDVTIETGTGLLN